MGKKSRLASDRLGKASCWNGYGYNARRVQSVELKNKLIYLPDTLADRFDLVLVLWDCTERKPNELR